MSARCDPHSVSEICRTTAAVRARVIDILHFAVLSLSGLRLPFQFICPFISRTHSNEIPVEIRFVRIEACVFHCTFCEVAHRMDVLSRGEVHGDVNIMALLRISHDSDVWTL